jgi:hypothetical protein
MLSGELELPDSLGFSQVIEREAFYGCRSLTTLYLPPSLLRIEEYVFNRCTGFVGPLDLP